MTSKYELTPDRLGEAMELITKLTKSSKALTDMAAMKADTETQAARERINEALALQEESKEFQTRIVRIMLDFLTSK